MPNLTGAEFDQRVPSLTGAELSSIPNETGQLHKVVCMLADFLKEWLFDNFIPLGV